MTINTVIMDFNILEMIPLIDYLQAQKKISGINLQAVVDPEFHLNKKISKNYFKAIIPKNKKKCNDIIDKIIYTLIRVFPSTK